MNDDFRAASNFFKTATGDLKSGLKEMKYMEDESDIRWAGYKFQQSLEKSFKSIIFCVDSSKFKPKHSIADLFDIVNEFQVINLSEEERKIATKIDKDFTKFRYPDDGGTIKKSNVELYKNTAVNILSKTKEFIYDMIPKFLIEFPDFDNLEPISKLKDWQDTSLSLDGRPSFEKKDEEGHLYKLFVGYSFYSEHNIKVPGENRYELLRDDIYIASGNDFSSILKSYESSLKHQSQK